MSKKPEEESTEPIAFVRDTTLNIHQRINAVMADVDYIKKDKTIPAGKKSYSVTGHDAVTKMVHPLLVKYGINLVPSFKQMEPEMILVKKQVWENNEKVDKEVEMHRVRVDASFQWVNIDDPKDFIEQSWSGYGCDSSDKGPGMAISYIQRYLVLKTLHIETGEEDIEENKVKTIDHSPAVKRKVAQDDLPLDATNGSQENVISAGAVVVLERKIKGRDISKEKLKDMLDQFKIDELSELPISKYKKMEKMINGEFPF